MNGIAKHEFPRPFVDPSDPASAERARTRLRGELAQRTNFAATNDVWTVDPSAGGRHRGYTPRHTEHRYDSHLIRQKIKPHMRWRRVDDLDPGAHRMPEVFAGQRSVLALGFEWSAFVGARSKIVSRVALNRHVAEKVEGRFDAWRPSKDGLPANLFPFPIVVDHDLPPNVIKFIDGITGATRMVEIEPF